MFSWVFRRNLCKEHNFFFSFLSVQDNFHPGLDFHLFPPYLHCWLAAGQQKNHQQKLSCGHTLHLTLSCSSYWINSLINGKANSSFADQSINPIWIFLALYVYRPYIIIIITQYNNWRVWRFWSVLKQSVTLGTSLCWQCIHCFKLLLV